MSLLEVKTTPGNFVKKSVLQDWKNPSGFTNGDTVDIAYNYTDRTITLTGTLTYYWKGVKKTLTSPWTSSAHDNTVGSWYLYTTDGTNFTWSNSVWTFDQVMVAYVYRGASATASFGVRETHRLMDWESHKETHQLFGTYWRSGGIPTVGTYATNTATDVATTPGFDQAIIKDEDLETTIPAWTEGTYTTAYVGGSSTLVFSTTESFPFLYTGGGYINYNNATAGTLVQGATTKYYNVYQILVPACSDSGSQKYRMIMLQPQAEYNSLSQAQGEDPRSLNVGNLANIFTEFTFYTRITYYALASNGNTGKVTIATGGLSYISGSRATLIASSSTVNNHASLANLGWTASGHTGTASTLAGFSSTGTASEYTLSGTGTQIPTTASPTITTPAFTNGITIDRATASSYVLFKVDGTAVAQVRGTSGGGVTITDGTSASTWFSVDSSGLIGIGTTAPDKKLEINSATGECLRLTYNDANGSATYYSDLHTSSAGSLELRPSSGNVDHVGNFYNLTRYVTSVYGPTMNIRHSRGTEATPVELNQNDSTGGFLFWGYKGAGARAAEFVPTGGVQGIVENDSATENLVKGALIFTTNATGDYSVDPTEKMRLTNAGVLRIAGLSTAGFVKNDASGNLSTGTLTGSLVYVIDGGGSAITTGIKGDIRVPFAGTITKATLLADQSGSIVVDIWKDTYANYPPVDADSITSATPPTISSATKSEDSTLSSWTTAIVAGSTYRFNVDSCTTITRCTVILDYTRTA